MACKKCKKVFRKDTSQALEEADEYCPHCDNRYVLEAKPGNAASSSMAARAEPVLVIGGSGDAFDTRTAAGARLATVGVSDHAQF